MKNIYLLSNPAKTVVSPRTVGVSLPSRCRVLPIILLCFAFSLHAWGGTDVAITDGTNGSSATVDGNTAVKIGTSSKGGDFTITVPSGATKLTLYVAAWKGVSTLSLNITPAAKVSPTSIALTPDDGLTGSSTDFTLDGSASSYKHEITLSGITSSTDIKFTTSTTKRCVAWGASYETSGGGSSCDVDPTVGNIMNAVSSITATGATFSTSAGVSAGTDCSLTEVGFVYGTSTTPTTTTGTKATIDSYTSGVLNKSVTGLTPNTTYYVRAYATNSHGTEYSDQKSFTTEAITGTDYELVTDDDDLEDGDQIIILNTGGTAALSTTQNPNNRASTASNWELNGTTVTVTGDNVEVFTLTAHSSEWELVTHDSKYLYSPGSNNYLRTQDASNENSVWSISIDGSSSEADIYCSTTERYIRKNSSSDLFSCYASGQHAIKIYKASSGPTISTSGTLSAFSYNYGEGPSASQTFTVKGSNLTGNLTVTAPSNYQVSLNGSSWNSSLTLTESAGTVSSTTIYVRLVSGLSVGTYNDNIAVSGGGASEKNVAVNGEVVIECTTPTLSFAGSVTAIEKVLGSGKFTIVASSPDNTLGATISYSSDNTSKATVDPSTGEVTLVQATGSGSPVTITATLAYKNTGVACQNEVTASYTLTIYNKVTWLVNDEEYTAGSPAPTTKALQGGQITQLPTDPNGASVCGGKTFIGWTTSAVIDPVDVAPTPMYKTVGDMSSVYINSNTEFYAVFAVSSGPDATPTLTKMGSGDTFENGDNVVIVAKDLTIAVYQETTSSSYVQTWTFDNNVATVAADDKNWLTVSTASEGWYLGDAVDGYLYNSGNNLSCNTNNKTIWTLVDNSDGSFRLLSSDDRFLSYRNDLSTTKWRMGGTSQGESGVVDLYVYKYSGSSVTYSDYSTVCGTCLPAPTSPTVSPKSNRATITWTAVPDATGYTVTCTGGAVSVDGTTATITGLTSETSYDFTIRSQGGDPYTCFPAYHGSFTTTTCEDSPALGVVTVTTTSATIPWTCEAVTATIRVYTDAECTDQVGVDHTLCTSPYTVSALTSNTTYYYKVWAGGTCASIVGSFKTEELKLDIAEWQTDAVVVSYNGDANLTLTTYTEETHGDPHANVADDIFFSKYFEAALNVKLLAIFNGTMNSVDLSNYKLGLAQAGDGTSVTKNFTFTKFSDFVKANDAGVDIGGLTEDELLLKPNEELILITYKNGDDDGIVACAKNDDEHSKFSTYVRVSTPNLQFNGDDVISLMNPDGDLIDLIGAGTKDGGLDRGGASFIYRSGGVDYNGFMDKPGGWYTANGYQANSDNTETFPYDLSTNRCLLIRRKFVKSGYAAVALNETDFVTLSAYSYDADNDGTPEDYEGEWKGVQIPGSATTGAKPGITNSCTGFAVVGGYNYNEYYVDFDQYGVPETFDDFKSNPFDGTYVIPVADLDDKACTQVRIELTDGSDNLVIRKDVKVPIMISSNQTTTDDIFHSHYKDAAICRECDVVVLNGGTLTKVADGTTGDIDEVRDLKIYQGGKLVIPSGRNYTINSLAFRRQEDAVAMADIQGGLDINKTNAVYLDVRIDPTNWHYFTLPYDCNVSDITFSTGDPAVLGTDYLLKWYNGEKRAATQAGGCWEMVGASSVLKKGIGYIVALPGDNIIKKELRFPMANAVIADEKTDKTIAGVYGYGCDKDYTQVRANHRGWNLLGNPYFMPYTSDITDPLLIGKIVPDYSTDPWDGHYKFDETPATQLHYIVEPVDNGRSEYRQVAIADYEMTPFTCYFVQIGADDPLHPDPTLEQGVEFHLTKVNRSPVRRAPEEYEDVEDTHPVWCAVDLINSKDEKDETTLLISNDFTDEYDMMNDLVKMRGDYYQYAQVTTKPVLASRNNEGEMAFNALPDASAETGVPLNFFSAYSGSYTIAYNNKFDRDDEVKEVKLFDKTTNEWYDLMSEPYEFSTGRENNTTRFIISVRVERKRSPQSTTDIDNIGVSDGPRKILINGHVYIQRGAAIYDITGKQMLNF